MAGSAFQKEPSALKGLKEGHCGWSQRASGEVGSGQAAQGPVGSGKKWGLYSKKHGKALRGFKKLGRGNVIVVIFWKRALSSSLKGYEWTLTGLLFGQEWLVLGWWSGGKETSGWSWAVLRAVSASLVMDWMWAHEGGGWSQDDRVRGRLVTLHSDT